MFILAYYTDDSLGFRILSISESLETSMSILKKNTIFNSKLAIENLDKYKMFVCGAYFILFDIRFFDRFEVVESNKSTFPILQNKLGRGSSYKFEFYQIQKRILNEFLQIAKRLIRDDKIRKIID